MTPRSIRRAAERKALKAARKADRSLPSPSLHPESDPEAVMSEALCQEAEPFDDSTGEPLLFTPTPLSPAQLAANRSNAQLSTGSVSPEGKVKSSLNAVKTALTGRNVLLPSDDAPAYELHLRAYTDDFHPVGVRESDLVQSIADTAWRLKRIPCLENAIFAQGHIEFGQAFGNHDPSLRSTMIEVQTFIKYEKRLRNLQLQEARLVRRREKEITELRQLQEQRRQKELQALDSVATLYLTAQQTGEAFEPVSDGFVFSIAQIEHHLHRVRARNLSRTAPARVPQPGDTRTAA